MGFLLLTFSHVIPGVNLVTAVKTPKVSAGTPAPRMKMSFVQFFTFMQVNRPLPSSKNLHFQNEARYTTFLVKVSFICMRMKNDFHIKGWAPPTLVLKQRPWGTRKWPIKLLWILKINLTFYNNFCQTLYIERFTLIDFLCFFLHASDRIWPLMQEFNLSLTCFTI